MEYEEESSDDEARLEIVETSEGSARHQTSGIPRTFIR